MLSKSHRGETMGNRHLTASFVLGLEGLFSRHTRWVVWSVSAPRPLRNCFDPCNDRQRRFRFERRCAERSRGGCCCERRYVDRKRPRRLTQHEVAGCYCDKVQAHLGTHSLRQQGEVVARDGVEATPAQPQPRRPPIRAIHLQRSGCGSVSPAGTQTSAAAEAVESRPRLLTGRG